MSARIVAKPVQASPQVIQASDEAAVVARVRAGDAQVFDALVVQYAGPLCDFVYRYVRAQAVAEDLVQDVFCAIWERRQDWRPPSGIAAYLYRAARNRALNYGRDRRVELVFTERFLSAHRLDSASGRQHPDAQQKVEADELVAAVDRAVAALPERCRAAFILSRGQGLSYADVASVLGISIKTVEIHIAKALGALRHALQPLR